MTTMMVVEGKDNKTTTDDKHDTPFCNSNAYFLLLFVDNIFQFIASTHNFNEVEYGISRANFEIVSTFEGTYHVWDGSAYLT